MLLCNRQQVPGQLHERLLGGVADRQMGTTVKCRREANGLRLQPWLGSLSNFGPYPGPIGGCDMGNQGTRQVVLLFVAIQLLSSRWTRQPPPNPGKMVSQNLREAHATALSSGRAPCSPDPTMEDFGRSKHGPPRTDLTDGSFDSAGREVAGGPGPAVVVQRPASTDAKEDLGRLLACHLGLCGRSPA